MIDPYFLKTRLQLPFKGANGSTTFTDIALSPKVVTVNGSVQISTAQSKWGGSSGIFNGTTGYLTLDGSSDFAFGTNDFTIEGWFYFVGVAGTQSLYDARSSGSSVGPAIILTGGVLTYYASGLTRITGTTSLSTSTWYHIAASRSGTSTRLFLDGTQEGSTWTDTTDYTSGANRPSLGAYANTPADFFNGHMDDVRVIAGAALYTTAFTAPTAAFPEPIVSANLAKIYRPPALKKSTNLPFYHIGL